MKLWLTIICMRWTATAHAGGFELPGNDAEALGRGAAFTAKADNGAALEYNVAGLARQRGTRVLLSGNLLLHDYTFQRTGNYPGDAADKKTPYAGQPFPSLSNTAAPFFPPLAPISTDSPFFHPSTSAIGL